MKRKREILTAVLLSSSLGLGAQSIWAQGAPGGGQTGPRIPGQCRDNRAPSLKKCSGQT